MISWFYSIFFWQAGMVGNFVKEYPFWGKWKRLFKDCKLRRIWAILGVGYFLHATVHFRGFASLFLLASMQRRNPGRSLATFASWSFLWLTLPEMRPSSRQASWQQRVARAFSELEFPFSWIVDYLIPSGNALIKGAKASVRPTVNGSENMILKDSLKSSFPSRPQ